MREEAASNGRPTTTSARRRRLRRVGLASVLFASLALLGAGCLGPVTKLKKVEAVRFPETSDPSVVRVGDMYYIYGSNNHLRAPIFYTKDISRGYSLTQKNRSTIEGMPTKPRWMASSKQLWAPTVGKFGGRWVMYFSGDRKNPPQPNNPQCIGRAWATRPAGPFVPEPGPWHCGLRGTGGALDPQLFTDASGRRFLLAAFGDTESPIHAIRLDSRGNASGAPVAILGRKHPWEYHFIEQPAMTFDPVRKNYVLTYSAGRWWEPQYSTGIARCSTPMGPCFSDPSGPWVKSSNGRTGPGAMSFFQDTSGATRAIFSSFSRGHESTVGGRSASVYYVDFDPSMALTVVK